MEKKISLQICISSFVRYYGKQKSLRIVGEKRYSGKPYTVTSDWQKFQMKLHYMPCDEIAECLDENTNHFQQVKSFILNHGSLVKWPSNVSLFIAIAVDTSEMRFFRRKNTSICIRLQVYKTDDCWLPACRLPACPSVLLMNKTSTNSLIFYFDKAKQKMCVQVTWKNIPKYFVLFCRNNPLMLKGLKSVALKIIQMYHFWLKWKRYTVCTNWWDSNFLEWDSHFFQWDSYFLPDGSPELLFSKS